MPPQPVPVPAQQPGQEPPQPVPMPQQQSQQQAAQQQVTGIAQQPQSGQQIQQLPPQNFLPGPPGTQPVTISNHMHTYASGLWKKSKCYELDIFTSSCTRNLVSSTVLTMGGSPGDVSEEPVTYEKRKKGWRMNCDVGEATEGLES